MLVVWNWLCRPTADISEESKLGPACLPKHNISQPSGLFSKPSQRSGFRINDIEILNSIISKSTACILPVTTKPST